jgi:hypothetical protein
METKLNIAEILRDKPQGTKLYSSACGKCVLKEADDKSFKISFYSSRFDFMTGGEGTFCKNGNLYDDGECIIFPSKEMRDWSKFAWKKCDVLVSNDSTTKVIFNGWKDDTYTLFRGAYAVITHNDGKVDFGSESLIFETCNYKGIEVEDDAQFYINYIEKKLGGKLNLETLEIEKSEFKDGDILCVIANSTDYHYILIYGGQDDKHIYRYVTMLENHSLIIEKGSYFTKPKDYSIRYATEEEKQQLFDALAKEGKAWDAKKKQIVDLPKQHEFKPFDKVLVRDEDDCIWCANIFSHINSHEEYVTIGCERGYTYCLPYEGNEHLLGTTKDVEG